MERRLQRGRDFETRGWDINDLTRVNLVISLQNGLCYFLDEQWYAIAPIYNVLANARCDWLISGEVVDHDIDFAPP